MSRPLVTVRTLLAQLRERGEIELPDGALITPAARDWLRGCRVPINNGHDPSRDRQGARTGETPVPPDPSRDRQGAVSAAPSGAPPRWFILSESSDPTVQAVLPALQRRWPHVEHVTVGSRPAEIAAAINRVVADLAGCPRRRALALVADGALAACVANRLPHVRAAVLTRPTALYTLQHALGINLLILEREKFAFAQVRATIERYFSGPIAVEPELHDLLVPKPPAADERLAVKRNGVCRCGGQRACPCGS